MSDQELFTHILIIEDTKAKRIVTLDDSTYSLGRASNNSIIIHDPLASRYHATLLRKKSNLLPKNSQLVSSDSFWVIDGDLNGKKSTNGILINGQKFSSYKLQHGDIIYIGKKTKIEYNVILNSDRKKPEPSLNLDLEPDLDLDLDLEADLDLDLNLDIDIDIDIEPDLDLSEQIADLEKAAKLKENKCKILEESKQTIMSDETPDFEELSHPDLVRLASFPELSPNPIMEMDIGGNLTYLNPAAIMYFSDIYQSKQNHPLVMGLLDPQNYAENKLFVREVTINNQIFEQYVHYLGDNQLIRSYIFDFTERKQIENALRESEERYRAVVRQTSEGIFLVDVTTKKIIEANQVYCDLLGYSLEEILELTLYDLVSLEPDVLEVHLAKIIEQKLYLLGEISQCGKNGCLVDVEVSASLINSNTHDVFCFAVHDISARKKSEQVLKYHAYHDSLTELPNREFFNQALNKALIQARNNQEQMAVMFLDLDRFKNINDSLGHAVGDELLKRFAQRLKFCLRSNDLVARWGGDEFTILLPNINDNEEAAKVGQRILDALNPPFKLQTQQLHIRSSIGIAVYPQDGEDAQTLLKNADSALYRTKERGRNNYHFYTATMNADVSEMLQLENRLYRALEQKEFLLYYQPQINVKTREICGIEALLRWHNPEKGIISPSKFMPLAEETGLITSITEWILNTACKQNKIWHQMGLPPMKISVNLSAKQLQKSDLIGMVANTLTFNNLDARYLELEIIETTLIDNHEYVQTTLENLQNMGISICLDDFGSGYSSLGYLKQFQFQTLKIDQSFVKEIKDNSEDLAIVLAILALAKGFNLRVVAEGIEREEQLNLLQNLGCEEFQGYWFSQPKSGEKTTDFLISYYRELEQKYKSNYSITPDYYNSPT